MVAYPPPGLAFGEPDDKLERGIAHRDSSIEPLVALEYWITRFRW
jgi:hypothetical protein